MLTLLLVAGFATMGASAAPSVAFTPTAELVAVHNEGDAEKFLGFFTPTACLRMPSFDMTGPDSVEYCSQNESTDSRILGIVDYYNNVRSAKDLNVTLVDGPPKITENKNHDTVEEGNFEAMVSGVKFTGGTYTIVWTKDTSGKLKVNSAVLRCCDNKPMII